MITKAPEDFTSETTTVWDFPERGTWGTHKADYRGNFAPQVPRNVILNYSTEGDLVLDPMVGGGTTLVEARLLGRNAVGFDVNQTPVNLSRERLAFAHNGTASQTVDLGDVRYLHQVQDNSVDLIITHPPYLDLVQYSAGENPDDLSSFSGVPQYLDELEKGIRELHRTLKEDHYCAVLIGDTRKGQHYLPLSHFVLRRFLRSGFALKEDIIKTQHNTTHGRRWGPNAKRLKFYLIMHEHLFIFRKPRSNESLSRIRYSTWKGFSTCG